jgi:hypothetical protein
VRVSQEYTPVFDVLNLVSCAGLALVAGMVAGVDTIDSAEREELPAMSSGLGVRHNR